MRAAVGPRITEYGPASGASQQHEEQQQWSRATAGVLHGGGAVLSPFRGNPRSGGRRDLLQGRVGQELRGNSREALRQDGAVHGGGDQV